MTGEQTNLMTIELSDADAVLFLAFQKNYDNFKLLNENGVFDTRNGNVEIHFNEYGILGSIIKHQMIYRKGKEVEM